MEARGTALTREVNPSDENQEEHFIRLCDVYRQQHENRGRGEWIARRAALIDEKARLQGFARRSNAQQDELRSANAELSVLDVMISDDDVVIRRAKVDAAGRLRRTRRTVRGPSPGRMLLPSRLWCSAPGTGWRHPRR